MTTAVQNAIEDNAPLTVDYLKTIPQDGDEVPKSRLSSAANGRSLFLQDCQNYLKRSRRNALVAGLIDGNAPLSQAELTKSGQRWRSNFNTGEPQAFLEIALTAFYDLSTEVSTLATVQTDFPSPEAMDWSEKIQKNFDWLLKQDEDMDYGLQLSQHEMVVYGAGPMIWNDELNWQAKPLRNQFMRLPQGCKATVNEWSRCSIEYEYTVGELYRYICNEKIAEAAGWNVEAVKTSIKNAGNIGGVNEWNQWETWQRMLRDNEQYWSDRVPRIRIARLLVKEFADEDGEEKISDAWLDVNSTDDKWLFRKDKRFTRMSEAVCPFFYDRGNGDAHGIKGLGVKMYPLMVQTMRTMMATVDSAYSNSTTMVKATGSANNPNLQVMHMGPFSILPGGYDYVQRNLAGAMEPLFTTRRELQNTLASNLSQYRQRQDKVDGNPKTATQINAELQQNSLLGKTQIARYFEQRDHYFQEVFRRAVNPKLTKSLGKWAELALQFQARCKLDGVPDGVYKFCRVRATRTSGQGSSFLRTQSLVATRNLLGPSMPADGLVRINKDIVAAIVGQEMVSRYWPEPPERIGEQDQVWEAQMENASFSTGAQIPVTPTQYHEVHLRTHFAFLDAAAGTVPQGANPQEVLKTLQAGGANCAAHLQRFAADPMNQQAAKEFNAQLQQLAGVVDQLQKHVLAEEQKAKEQAADAQSAAAMQDAAIKSKQAEQDMALKDAKTGQQLGLKKANHDLNTAIKVQNHQQSMATKDAQTAQTITLNQAKAAADLALKEEKSDGES